jgi:hypothetical protein
MEYTMRSYLNMLVGTALLLATTSCGLIESSTEGPNEMGGDGNIDLTEVGNSWGVSFNTETFGPGFSGVEEDIKLVSNENGVITLDATLTFDTVATKALDTLLGVTELPQSVKMGILDTYLARYGASIDTTDKGSMKLRAILKAKITDRGMQEYFSSGGNTSRPFTIVKYDAAIGDSYEFTLDDGTKKKRTVMSRSTTDDYPVAFWLLKVIKVKEETVDAEDPLLDELWYITNHKYGLVGIEGTLKSGKPLKITVFPPTL